MSNIVRIYFDFLYNLFLLLFLLHLTMQHSQKKINRRIIFLFVMIQFVYSIPAYIPFSNLCSLLLDFLFVLLLCYPKIKQIFWLYIEYEFAVNIIFAAVYFFHSLLLWDFRDIVFNKYYFQCKNLICISLIYIFYVLYTNTKQIKAFHTRVQLYFNLLIILISVVLSYLTLYLCKTDTSASYVIPVLFSFIYILIIGCILIYDKFIALLSENAKTRIQLEKSQLELQYSAKIADNLKTLSAIRHDMKNHLIIIHGYASQNNCSKILEYIEKASESFAPSYLIQTPSETVSALLNAKYQEASHMQISCDFTCDFKSIHIDDYDLIIILGNLLDNALTASGKRLDGYIHFSMKQMDSYLKITLANNHVERIRESHGSFITTKPNPHAFHGIGIKNVRSVINSLKGQMNITYTAQEFQVTVIVPNY